MFNQNDKQKTQKPVKHIPIRLIVTALTYYIVILEIHFNCKPISPFSIVLQSWCTDVSSIARSTVCCGCGAAVAGSDQFGPCVSLLSPRSCNLPPYSYSYEYDSDFMCFPVAHYKKIQKQKPWSWGVALLAHTGQHFILHSNGFGLRGNRLHKVLVSDRFLLHCLSLILQFAGSEWIM